MATLAPPAPRERPPATDAASLQLSVELTRFVGREREISTLRELLGGTRLLTLTGAGGSGKTRLAREVAALAASDHADGLAWVELGPLASPELLPQQVAAALGIREAAGRSLTETLLEALREQQRLLVLDNCEHLVDACARLAELLLRGCARLTILATSREALGVAGERAWLVPALSLPDLRSTDAADVARAEAVQLFLDRARDAVPAFQLTDANAPVVARICHRLDGLPLALELAAARVRVLTPEQIAERLGDAFRLLSGGRRTAVPRQQTLRATMDWSYALLSEREQVLLQRLSVFAGGFTIEAAEAVCADEQIESFDVLDLLSALVDRSLVAMQVRSGEARYDLLETVRQYGRELLSQAGGLAYFLRRHAEFFLGLAEEGEAFAFGPERLQRIAEEHDNLRAVLRWAVDRREAEIATRLVARLSGPWLSLAKLDEGRTWLREVLAMEGSGPPSARATALRGHAMLSHVQRDWVTAETLLEEALAISRRLNDVQGVSSALLRMGSVALEQGQLERAERLLEEALAMARDWANEVMVSAAVNALAATVEAKGDDVRARALYEESLALVRDSGYAAGIAVPLGNLARIAFRQGDLQRAAALFHERLVRAQESRDVYRISLALYDIADLASAQGDVERAARLYGVSEALRAVLGAPHLNARRQQHEHHLAKARSRADEASWSRWWHEGEAMSLDEAVAYALARAGAASGAGPAEPEPRTDDRPQSPTAAPAPSHPAPAADRSAPAAPLAPPALRVCALGALQFYREGEPLPAESWSYARPKELLLYLLTHPQGRTREQIGLVFWPEASPAQVKNSFHVTLHHLRKALGRGDWIVFHEERYRINTELGCEFDAALFEEQLTGSLRLLRADARAVTPERLASLLDLYRGDFLEEESFGDWHLETRDHLRRLWLDGMLALGGLLVQAERWAEGAEVYQRIVRREDLREDAHRGLMLCWARAGERSRSLKHYEKLVALLNTELDTAPEAETIELHQRLKHSSPN